MNAICDFAFCVCVLTVLSKLWNKIYDMEKSKWFCFSVINFRWNAYRETLKSKKFTAQKFFKIRPIIEILIMRTIKIELLFSVDGQIYHYVNSSASTKISWKTYPNAFVVLVKRQWNSSPVSLCWLIIMHP